MNIMDAYEMEGGSYDLFGANMTLDVRKDISSSAYKCQKCQCNCHLCRGHRFPPEEGPLNNVETEKVLEKLLAA